MRPACFSGEGHDVASVNVELLADIRKAFGESDVMTSTDLVAALVADPERPWSDWKHGRPVSQKQLANLLRPFGIISETIHRHGHPDAKGYKRARFGDVWEGYCSGGHNGVSPPIQPSEASNRPSADGMGTSGDFSSVREPAPDGSKNGNLSPGHAVLDAWTDGKLEIGVRARSDHEKGAGDFPDSLRRCAQCNAPGDARGQVVEHDDHVWLHRDCQRFWLKDHAQ
jgi:hypothetical protein